MTMTRNMHCSLEVYQNQPETWNHTRFKISQTACSNTLVCRRQFRNVTWCFLEDNWSATNYYSSLTSKAIPPAFHIFFIITTGWVIKVDLYPVPYIIYLYWTLIDWQHGMKVANIEVRLGEQMWQKQHQERKIVRRQNSHYYLHFGLSWQKIMITMAVEQGCMVCLLSGKKLLKSHHHSQYKETTSWKKPSISWWSKQIFFYMGCFERFCYAIKGDPEASYVVAELSF